MTSRRGRSQGWAALAVVIGALLLFWAPAGASSIGDGSAVSAAADRVPVVVDHATPAAGKVGGATGDVGAVARSAGAAADDIGEVGDDVGSAVGRLLPGGDRDGESSGDRCGNDCRTSSEDRYDRSSREQPAPEQQCDDACRRSSAGGCGRADCPPRSSDTDYRSCPADREPAECRRPCGGCPERDERAERPPAPEPTAPPRCVERPGCPCGQAGAPGRPPSGANQPPSQPPPASPPAAQGPPPAQPAPSAPPGPSPAAPAPAPATEAASPGNRPAQAASTPPPTRPATQVAGQQSAAAPRHPARALPRTGARSRLVAMVGMAWIIGGLALMATGHIRRLSPVKR